MELDFTQVYNIINLLLYSPEEMQLFAYIEIHLVILVFWVMFELNLTVAQSTLASQEF